MPPIKREQSDKCAHDIIYAKIEPREKYQTIEMRYYRGDIKKIYSLEEDIKAFNVFSAKEYYTHDSTWCENYSETELILHLLDDSGILHIV